MPLTLNQIESLQNLNETMLEDERWRHERESLNRRCATVSVQMREFLATFLNGKISLKQFKETFAKKAPTEWNTFGQAGTSGGMFLNMLANNTRDPDAVATELKRALVVPDEQSAQQRMSQFFKFLEELNESDGVTGAGIRPNRVPFFLSSWWHVQEHEPWPPYYVSARQTFISLGLFSESGDPVGDYFKFRQVWLESSRALQMNSWALESVLAHAYESGKSKRAVESRSPSRSATSSSPALPAATGAAVSGGSPASPDAERVGDEANQETRVHTEIQWMLAKLGKQLGCKVWIASNDQNAAFNGTRLGSLALPELPNLGIGDQPQRIIRLIDVLWLRGTHQIVAAFEVESTTSVYSGLLRMADLNALCPNLSFPCYLVVPSEREDKVCRELSRPAFAALGIPSRCGYLTFEDLRRDYDPLTRLATSPEAVRRMAKFVQQSEYSAE